MAKELTLDQLIKQLQKDNKELMQSIASSGKQSADAVQKRQDKYFKGLAKTEMGIRKTEMGKRSEERDENRKEQIKTNIQSAQGLSDAVASAMAKSQLSAEKRDIKKRKEELANAKGMKKMYLSIQNAFGKGKKGGAEQKFESKIGKAADAAEQKKQTGFLAGLFKKSEDKDKEGGGFFGFIKKHWLALVIALGLLLTPLKHLGKAFFAIKDYFQNNSWGKIGKDIGLALLGVLAIKAAGGLLITTIMSSLGLGTAGTLGSALLAGFGKIAWGPMIKTMGWAGLALAVFKGVKAGYEEYEAGGSVKAIFNKGIEAFIQTLTLGLLPKGVAESWAKGTTNFFEGAYDFLFDKKTREKFGDSVKDVVRAIIPDTWRKELERIDAEKKKIKHEDDIGANTPEAIARRVAKEKRLKKEDDAERAGTTKHYKGASVEKQLDVARQDKTKWENELDKMNQLRTAQKGKLTDQQVKIEAGYEKKRQYAAKLVGSLEKKQGAAGGATPGAPAPAAPTTPASSGAAPTTPASSGAAPTTPASSGAAPATPAPAKPAGKLITTSSTPKTETTDKYPTIKDDGGTTDMGKVKWNQLHTLGRSGVEAQIWNIYNKHGKKPLFTSGWRGEGWKGGTPNPRSKHYVGLGFDLRTHDLGEKKSLISGELSSFFNQQNKNWFMQEEVKGQANTTGTKATADHFHIHKAALGFHGVIDEATGFIAGEAGKERVDITPLNDPSARMDGMNKLHDERMASQGGTPSINVVTSNQVNNSSDQSAVLIPANVRPKEIPV